MTEFQAEGGRGQLSDNNSFSPAAKERFLNVDFLRFAFAIIIFLHHYCKEYRLGNALGDIFNNIFYVKTGNMCVQYFFIIAGFFLIYTLNKNLSVMDFIKKKIIRLWPLLLFGFVLYALAGILGFVRFNIYPNLLCLVFLENIGVTLRPSLNGIAWFVSVLFIISIFYFYIFKYFKKTSYNFFIPILVLIGYTFLVHVTKGVISGNIQTVNNILNVGMINGLTGMGLGYLIHEFYQYLKTQPFANTIKSTIIYTIIEGYLLGFVVYESGFHKMHFNNKIILVVAFVCLFLTFLLKRGLVSRLFDNKFSAILGRYAFSLYMIHGPLWPYLLFILKPYKSVCVAHPYFCIAVCLIACLIFAVLTYHFVEVPAGRYLKKKFFPQKA